MKNPILLLTIFLAIVAAAILALLLVFGGTDYSEAYDVALKVGLALLVMLIAGWQFQRLWAARGRLLKNSSNK